MIAHRVLAVGAALVGAATSACGSQSTAGPQTPAQLLSSSELAFQKLHSFHVTGGFIVNSAGFYMAASVLHNGDATGSLTLLGETTNFVVANDASYFDTLNPFVTEGFGDAMLYLSGHLKGKHWWQIAPQGNLNTSLSLLRIDTDVAKFFTGRAHLTEKNGKDSRQRAAIKLSDGSINLFVATASPHQVLEISTAPHYLSDNLSQVDLVFDAFNATVNVVAPSGSVSPTPEGLPAFFILDSVEFHGDCNSVGCPVKADVSSEAGSGNASVHFTVSDANSRLLGACNATASVTVVSGMGTATCSASGAGWTRFYYGAGGTYSLHATIDNPAYTSD